MEISKGETLNLLKVYTVYGFKDSNIAVDCLAFKKTDLVGNFGEIDCLYIEE